MTPPDRGNPHRRTRRVILLLALCGVLAAGAGTATAQTPKGVPPKGVPPKGVPMGAFDVTVRVPAGGTRVRRHVEDGPFCEFFDNGLWAVLGIDIPAEEDAYTVQYPGVEFRATQFGLDLKKGLAQIRIYFGPYPYRFAIGGDYEPEYYQWLLHKDKGHYRVEGGPDGGRLTVLVDGLKSFEGFPPHQAQLVKGATITWRHCRRIWRRNMRTNIWPGK